MCLGPPQVRPCILPAVAHSHTRLCLPHLPGSSWPSQPQRGSFASTGKCTLLSPTSPLSTGVCVRRLLAACSAPAPTARPKASSMCPVRKVHAGRLHWGLGRLGPAFPYRCDSLCSAQGPPLCHLRLQPLREHGLREASRAAAGGYRGHGLRGLWNYWHQPYAAGGQPCHRRPGTWTHFGQMPKGRTAPGLQTSTGSGGHWPSSPQALLLL